jgi:hypothetical protein
MMTRERYARWIEVWKWFQTQPRSVSLEKLYELLNGLWQEDRAGCTQDQLAAYSQPLDLENDPAFRRFLDDLNRGFSH